MAQRKRRNVRGSKSDQPSAGSYQEGGVESVGGGPSGPDTDDRIGRGTRPPMADDVRTEHPTSGFVPSEVDRESVESGAEPPHSKRRG